MGKIQKSPNIQNDSIKKRKFPYLAPERLGKL
jgi:hypothetical protein